VVGLASRVLNRGEDIFFLEEGILRQDLLKGRPGGQQFQDIGYPNAKATDTRVPPAFAFFNRDPLKPFQGHAFEV